jgi:molecular chaperone GrpE
VADEIEKQVEESLNDLESEREPDSEAVPAEDEGQEVATEQADELEALRQELEETKAKETEYLDGWQRARAELANARKRFQREREQSYSNARADILVRLLPIVDDFARAFETLPGNLSSLTWVDGVQLVQRKLQLLLEQEGVQPIEACGAEFDPFLHQAVTHEPSEEVPEGHVISEMQTGYTMSERVLRPSVVRVSAGAPEETESESSQASDTEEPEQEQPVGE